MAKSDAERRRAIRIPLTVPVKARQPGERTEAQFGFTADISSTGVQLTLPHPVPIGTEIQLQISLPPKIASEVGMPTEVRARAKVVRSSSKNKGNAVAVAMISYDYPEQK